MRPPAKKQPALRQPPEGANQAGEGPSWEPQEPWGRVPPAPNHAFAAPSGRSCNGHPCQPEEQRSERDPSRTVRRSSEAAGTPGRVT